MHVRASVVCLHWVIEGVDPLEPVTAFIYEPPDMGVGIRTLDLVIEHQALLKAESVTSSLTIRGLEASLCVVRCCLPPCRHPISTH